MQEIVINDVYIPHLENMSETQIYYGGSGSGKSVFLSQRLVLDVIHGERNYLVSRKVQKSIRKSVFNEIESVIDEFGFRPYFMTNKTEMSITCNNGYQILFAGLDNPLSLQGVKPKKGVITDLWVDEATEIERDDLKILSKRLRGGSENIRKRKTFSFNPIMKNHWIYDEYFKNIGWEDKQTEYITPELSILKTWFIHNKFMTQQDIDNLLNEKDEYYRNVYAFGEWGVLGDVIFTNWRVEDLSEMHDQFTNRRNGLDFGFSSDPAAVGVSHYDRTRKTIYFFKELYETGLTNDVLAERIKDMIGNERIICDSAEPKSIQELNNHGVSAVGAKKGKDSVNFGIDWLKQQTIVVDKSCINLQNELSQYHWKKDAGGNSLKIPVDKNNHLIDGGLRYAYEDDMEDIDPSKIVDWA